MTERERFEAWLLSEGYPSERLKMRGRIYVDDHVDDLWDGWQARALLAAGASEGQAVCVDCGDTIMAHDPGTCGNCHSMKYVPAFAEIAALRERIAGMEKDSERYRWLRDPDNSEGPNLVASCDPKELDDAIDAAIAKEKNNAK